jgi:hypothetical protein
VSSLISVGFGFGLVLAVVQNLIFPIGGGYGPYGIALNYCENM